MKKLMLSALSAAFVAAIALLLGSCIGSEVIRGSGREAHGAFDIVRNYTALDVSNGITVVLGAPDMVEGLISADDNVLDYVSIVEEGGRVKVSYVSGISVMGGVRTVVTLPVSLDLNHIEVSSAAKVRSSTDRIVAQMLEIDLSSAAEVELDIDARELTLDLDSASRFRGNLAVNTLNADLDSAAGCDIAGRADICNIETDSAAGFRGLDLSCRRVEAKASSAGNIEVTVTDELLARASSGGSINYKGAPTIVSRDASGGGSVREIAN